MSRIPYGKQWIDDGDVEALVAAAGSDFLTQGPEVAAFEQALAAAVGAPYAVAVSSGTAALHLAAMAAGVGPGDVTVTTPLTFAASANATLYCGGRVRFCDVDRDTRNLSPTGLARILDETKAKLVVPVHFAGQPADMGAIHAPARARGAMIVEDGCHALGAGYRVAGDEAWHRVGSCDHSDMTVFSFHPVKHITTGEGGAITTRSEALYRKLVLLRTHGITKDPRELTPAPPVGADADPGLPPELREIERGPWYYEMQALGFNYRITDLQCALGRSQLARLESFVARRREIAARYDAAFADLPGVARPLEPSSTRSSYHLYPLWLDEAVLGRSRRQVFEGLMERGLGVQVHYIPVHLQPYYRERFGGRMGQFPEAERFYRGAISIPMFPRMTDDEVARVIDAVRAVASPA